MDSAASFQGRLKYLACGIFSVVFWEICRNALLRALSDPIVGDDSSGEYRSAAVSGDVHPPNIPFTLGHDSHFGKFVAAANRALKSAYPEPPPGSTPRYSNVRALLIQWERDGLGAIAEVKELKRVLRDIYGYVAETYGIPEEDPQSSLFSRIQGWIEGASESDLLIVYYGGHSDDSHPERSIWKSGDIKGAAMVDWGLAQKSLLDCPSDVLILLDTCFAGKWDRNVSGAARGVNELIGATNDNSLATGINRFSFTAVLTRVLENFAQKHQTENTHLTAARLYSDLHNYWPKELKKCPRYASMTEFDFNSCHVVPLKRSPDHFQGGIASSISPEPEAVTVLAAIYLGNTPDDDVITWLQGQGTPLSYINGTQTHIPIVDAVYEADSSILVLRCPLAVWRLLPSDLCCTFIGLVRSSNLLKKGDRESTTSTSPKIIEGLNPDGSSEPEPLDTTSKKGDYESTSLPFPSNVEVLNPDESLESKLLESETLDQPKKDDRENTPPPFPSSVEMLNPNETKESELLEPKPLESKPLESQLLDPQPKISDRESISSPFPSGVEVLNPNESLQSKSPESESPDPPLKKGDRESTTSQLLGSHEASNPNRSLESESPNPPSSYDEWNVFASEKAFDRQVREYNEGVPLSIASRRESIKAEPQARTIYSYSAIDFNELRLFELLPGAQGQPLTGRLVTVNAATAPPYNAISYIWNWYTTEMVSHITILPSACSIRVSSNVASVLDTLRDTQESQFLWVDIICVDQTNDDETTAQVTMMPEIFRDASCITVWLGESAAFTQLAVSFAERGSRSLNLTTQFQKGELMISLMAFFAFLRNPWFRRKWVIQEFVFSNQVILRYGKDILTWETMADYIKIIRFYAADLVTLFHNSECPEGFLEFLHDFDEQGAVKLVDLRDNLYSTKHHPLIEDPITILESLVTRVALFATADPRDALYSQLSLALNATSWSKFRETSSVFSRSEPASDNSTLQGSPESPVDTVTKERPKTPRTRDTLVPKEFYKVDYDKPAADVCKDFVATAVAHSKRLDILCRPWAPELPDLPSWVCTIANHSFEVGQNNQYYRVNADSLTDASWPNPAQQIYSASGHSNARHAFIVGTGNAKLQLSVEGFLLDTIGTETAPALNGTIPSGWLKLNDVMKSPPDRFWRTLVGDRGPHGANAPALYGVAYRQLLREEFFDSDFDTRAMISSTSAKPISEFLRRVESITWGRKFISTSERDYVGLVPRNSVKGDFICILFGCSVPVVLRKVPGVRKGEEAHYVVIGECFIYGVMDGEAVILQKTQGLKTVQFKLW